ncbi:Methyltransferase domain-containing protein [Ruaniaceae bacterium KH17]|nr:Methyltransferase domain-containing protein [Ruaniaceae bacterium KH17]
MINDVVVDQVDVPAADGGISEFRFPVRDMWRYCGPEDAIRVCVDGVPLQMPGGSVSYAPRSQRREPLTDLVARLSAGEIVNSKGALALPKYLDREWQRVSSELYSQLREALLAFAGYEPFLIYGSLLGAVREGRPLGHDYDFDIAYLSKHSNSSMVQDEVGRLALELQSQGFFVEARVTCLHIASADRSQRVDLYHTYFDSGGELRLAWGQATETPFTRDSWGGLTPVDFCGSSVLIPRNSEALIAVLYGPDWRTPNPGFSWTNRRTRVAKESFFPRALAPSINWHEYWLSNRFEAPSSFATYLAALNLSPARIIDLGCGDGRDVAFFVREGARVVGIDRAPTAIESARGRRLDSTFARFTIADLSDPHTLSTLVSEIPADEVTLFYARQLLDSMDASNSERLIASTAGSMSPGDYIALEFHGLNDTTFTEHELLSCGRRLVDVDVVRELLASQGIAIIDDQESDSWEKRGKSGGNLHRLIGIKSSE